MTERSQFEAAAFHFGSSILHDSLTFDAIRVESLKTITCTGSLQGKREERVPYTYLYQGLRPEIASKAELSWKIELPK